LIPSPTKQSRIPAPGLPRVPDQDLPRVATPMAPSHSFSPSPAKSLPLPLPPASAIQRPQLSPLPFPVVPRCLTFADSPLPLVVSPPPRVAIEPNLPQREPIAQRTQSRAPVPPLALFADARPYRERVTYHMPTAKTTPKNLMALQTSAHHLIEWIALTSLPSPSWILLQVNSSNIANFVVTPATRPFGVPPMPTN
jgi:hypothetical protein